MATNLFTASYFLASLKRKGWVASSTALTTADILDFINTAMRVHLAALLKSARDEYLVNEADYNVTLVAGTAQYRVPTRCTAAALRAVWVVDSQGNLAPLTRIDPESRHDYPGTGSPAGYMLRGHTLQVLPTPSGAGTLRLAYLQRLSSVVEVAECGLITVINTGTGALTLSATKPSAFTTSETYDLVAGKQPFSVLATDIACSAASGSSITLTAASLPSGLAAGDYVALAGQTPIPNVAEEYHEFIKHQVIVDILTATGGARLDAAKAKLKDVSADVLRLATPRVTASARPVVNSLGPGMRRFR